MTVAIGIGGTMTYGQTVGLTHDPELVGNWEALRWGMLGLMIKGGIWIGFAGAFLGMGLSDKRYLPWEMLFIFLAMIGLMYLGCGGSIAPLIQPTGSCQAYIFQTVGTSNLTKQT